jgi:hypothetical protein
VGIHNLAERAPSRGRMIPRCWQGAEGMELHTAWMRQLCEERLIDSLTTTTWLHAGQVTVLPYRTVLH